MINPAITPAAIHATALIGKKAQIGANVTIGPFTIIEDNVIIGDDVTIESHCHLGIKTRLANSATLHIGAKSVIRSHSRFYCGSDFSKGIVTGHGVTIRENTIAGAGLQIGTQSDIHGDCSFGDYTRLHSSVFVPKGSVIGNFVWLSPCVVLTNDPHPPSDVTLGVTIHDYAIVAARSVVLPGIHVGARALVAAGSVVARDVAPDTVVAGSPAKKLGEMAAIKHRDNPELAAYPWIRHFHRGYPDEIVAQWKDGLARAEESKKG